MKSSIIIEAFCIFGGKFQLIIETLNDFNKSFSL